MHRISALGSLVGLLVVVGCQTDTPVGIEKSPNLYFSQSGVASQADDADHFLVAFSGSVGQLTAAVHAAGGAVDRAHSEIGVAKVSGLNDEQAASLSQADEITTVTRDLVLQWVPANPDVRVLELSVPEESPGKKGGNGKGHKNGGTETHNDPTDAFFFDRFQWNMRQVDAPAAWGVEQGDPNVRVCILDTGISPTHIDLAGKYDLNASINFSSADPTDFEDRNFHGTFVSGIVSTNNLGVAGVAPHVTLVGVKVLDDSGSGSFSDVISGIIYATVAADCDIINMSLGAYFPRNITRIGTLVGALAKAVNFASTDGALVVASAGNSAIDLDHDGEFIHVPSQSGSATSVSATAPFNQQNFDALAFYSNFGVTGANVAAPGGNSPIAVLEDLVISPAAPALLGGATNFYFLSAGTSFSAPLAAGITALIDSRAAGGLNGGQLRTTLEESADDLGEPDTDPIYGKGRVNAFNAVTQ